MHFRTDAARYSYGAASTLACWRRREHLCARNRHDAGYDREVAPHTAVGPHQSGGAVRPARTVSSKTEP